MLISDWLDDKDEWGFKPTDSFGSAAMLLPGEAFVIENYMGSGTLPNRGITFTDENGELRLSPTWRPLGYPRD
jgi:hypothetical protein